MFEKITAARETLRRLHSGDPSYAAFDALFGAIQETLEGLEKRIAELEKKPEPIANAPRD